MEITNNCIIVGVKVVICLIGLNMLNYCISQKLKTFKLKKRKCIWYFP